MKKSVCGGWWALITLILAVFILAVPLSVQATPTPNIAGGLSTASPDLFTGAMSSSVPIAVPPGRNGMQPGVTLTYHSSNPTGPLGLGWTLGVGSIERNTKNGIDYSGNDYVFHDSGGAVDLVQISDGTYRAKIEGMFVRFQKYTSSNGPYWIATDESGTLYYYGIYSSDRLDNPSDSTQIVKWCLEFKLDTNGNSVLYQYIKDSGSIYLHEIYYNNNEIKFIYEDQASATQNYYYNFITQYKKDLKTIAIYANGNINSAYTITYSQGSDNNTLLLSSIQRYGNLISVDSSGTVVENTPENKPPPEKFSYSASGNIFVNKGSLLSGAYGNWDGAASRIRPMDVNGDGWMDIVIGPDANGKWYVLRSLGSSFANDGAWITGAYGNWDTSASRIRPMDVNGDGKMDIVIGPDANGKWYVLRSTGSGFVNDGAWITGAYGNWDTSASRIRPMDVNGDGKTDIVIGPDGSGHWYVLKSTGSGFVNEGSRIMGPNGDGDWSGTAYGNWDSSASRIRPMDVNGDGKMDIVIGPDANGKWYVLRSTGDGFVNDGAWITGAYGNWDSSASRIRPMDVNGDGKMDIVIGPDGSGHWYVLLSTGQSFVNEGSRIMGPNGEGDWSGTAYGNWDGAASRIRPMDVNGDGKMDIVIGPEKNSGNWYVLRSTGNGFVNDGTWITGAYGNWYSSASRIRPMDVNGDGKTDIVIGPDGSGHWYALQPDGPKPNMLSKITNSLGATTTIAYKPSTNYINFQLPFPIQVVSSVTTDDGNGVVSTTSYDYSGGYYDLGARDFRGFHFVKVTGPVGPHGEQTITWNYFHQGDETGLVDNPYGAVGYMKGKPYITTVLDSTGKQYSVTSTTYGADNSPPYFNPPTLVQKTIDPGASNPLFTKVAYTYDNYGNITKEDQYGNVNDPTDDRTTVHSFKYNTTAWILDLPSQKTVYKGIGTGGQKMSQTTYYYDGSGDTCTTPSTNQTPSKGNLTRVVSWLNGGTSPQTLRGYDSYGNLICTQSAKGYANGDPLSTITYDSTGTFPVTKTNPLGQQTTISYYGVNGVAADKGLYGQVKTVTDPNGGWTTNQYDAFGRKIKETLSDGSYTSWDYLINLQYNLRYLSISKSPSGEGQAEFFDGLGRVIQSAQTGGTTQPAYTDTVYDQRGAVESTSLPYFSGNTVYNSIFTHDPMGRVTQITHPDGLKETACYDGGVLVKIDANGHRKRETRDAFGRLTKVEEYKGTYSGSSCTTDEGTPYATTSYSYDVLGDLTSITDAQNNQTTMTYDTLGRKKTMHDPDMGNWSYTYDLNGILSSQTDAKNQTINFKYDALNRLKEKDYPSGTNTHFYYDESGHGYSIGRLTRMTDASGSTSIKYDDALGEKTETTKTVGGTGYKITKVVDELGRTKSVTYPDGETVGYSYTGRNLYKVGSYATYSNYNALGQPKMVTYGNGVVTNYTYQANDSRILTINTAKSSSILMDLHYNYQANGNIWSISNTVDPSESQSFNYDELNRLTTASSGKYGTLSYSYDKIGNFLTKAGVTYTPDATRPHAVGATSDGRTYTYDANGNMTSDGLRTFQWNYDNKPTLITYQGATTSFVYDGHGNRVKKIGPSGTTIYIGNLYEVSGGVPSKYILANGKRIALKTMQAAPLNILYYHQNHLGSTGVVTDVDGNKVEDIFYKPFGESVSDTGTVSVNHKFTGKELDAETGLYFYNARYYNPVLGKFISPDLVVPDPTSPQSLNRYSYAINNPLQYVDPTGHGFFSFLKRFFGSVISKVMDDWLGIEQIQIGGSFVCGFEFGVDFRHHGVSITRMGVMVGFGGYMKISTPSFDLDTGSMGAYASAGYDTQMGFYGSAGTGVGPLASVSATYYPRSGEFSAYAGVGYKGLASMGASYDRYGGWSGVAFLEGARYTYNFNSHKGRIGFHLDIEAMEAKYNYAVTHRAVNGYGSQAGNGSAFNKIIDVIGTLGCGYKPADIHDTGYSTKGASKSYVDLELFGSMEVGAFSSNLGDPNGIIQTALGLVAAPVYYAAVSLGGYNAYMKAQADARK